MKFGIITELSTIALIELEDYRTEVVVLFSISWQQNILSDAYMPSCSYDIILPSRGRRNQFASRLTPKQGRWPRLMIEM